MFKLLFIGFLSAFIEQLFLGISFTSEFVRGILYNPKWQSTMFIQITQTREIPYSISGLLVWSTMLVFVFQFLSPILRGFSFIKKVNIFSFGIWFLYWLPQEWFIYHTLLKEPILLSILELSILGIGCFLHSLILVWLYSVFIIKESGKS